MWIAMYNNGEQSRLCEILCYADNLLYAMCIRCASGIEYLSAGQCNGLISVVADVQFYVYEVVYFFE